MIEAQHLKSDDYTGRLINRGNQLFMYILNPQFSQIYSVIPCIYFIPFNITSILGVYYKVYSLTETAGGIIFIIIVRNVILFVLRLDLGHTVKSSLSL